MSALEQDINCNLGVLHLSTWLGGGTMWDKHRRLRQPCLSEWGDLQVSRDTSKLWVVVSILKSVSGTEPPDTAARVYQGGEVSDILLVKWSLPFTLRHLYGSIRYTLRSVLPRTPSARAYLAQISLLRPLFSLSSKFVRLTREEDTDEFWNKSCFFYHISMDKK